MRRHVAQLSKGLRAFGIESVVAGPEVALEELDPETARVVVPITPSVNPLADAASVSRLASAARRADLIHGHGLRGAALAAAAGVKSRTPVVITVHNRIGSPSLLTKLGLRGAFRHSRAIIAVSQAVAEDIGLIAPGIRTVEVIPNGVELPEPVSDAHRAEARRRMGLAGTDLVVLAVGRLEHEKGFDVLLRAASELADRGSIRILIAGDGSRREELESLAGKLGLGSTVRFLGYRTDLSECYAAADVVAAPSRSEGQGLAALEAMAYGLPVIASRTGGLPEVVEDGVTGILVTPEDIHALAETLAALLCDPESRVRLGDAGRRKVERQFRLETMLERTADLYRSTVCER